MIAHFVLAGQSNIDQWFSAGDGVALQSFRQTFLELNPEYTDVQFFDAARGGSAMLSASASQYANKRASEDPALHARISDNYWYDEATQSAGPNLDLFSERLEAEAAKGTEFLGIIWAQGEADTTYVGAESEATYTEGLDYVLHQLMAASGAPEVFIQGLGGRAAYSETLHAGTQLIRDAQRAVADGSDAITLATTIFDLELRDTTHLTAEGYSSAAARMAVAVSTGQSSPDVGEAILLSPTTLLVKLDLSVDQSTPTGVGLGGFTLTDDGVEVPIESVTLTPSGLLRIEAQSELRNPTLTYGSAEDSVTMEPEDYIAVLGPDGETVALPFSLTVAASRHTIEDLVSGLSVQGTERSESLTGLSGDDVIHGGAGHDTIDGGWGSDDLTGGEGSDTFMLSADASKDVIQDFDVARDAIGLRGLSAAEVTFTASDDGDLIVEGPAGQQALLIGVEAEEAPWVILKAFGTEGDNVLAGSSGADRIYALAGDDMVDSGAGTDRIWLGEGSDIVRFGSGYGTNIVYDFDVAEDTIDLADLTKMDLTFQSYKDVDLEVRTGAGDRLVLRDVDLSLVDALQIVDAPPRVTHVGGSNDADVLHGTALDEIFEGFSGTDRIYSGGGNDVFIFRQGSDLNVVYDFDTTKDRIYVEEADAVTLEILAYKDTDAELRLSSGDRMVLRNIDPADLFEDELVTTLPEEFV